MVIYLKCLERLSMIFFQASTRIITFDPKPIDNQPTTYRIVANFEGYDQNTATAYGTTPNGTRYAVCSTIHYGFKPSSNSTMLTVEPHGTTTTTPTKTPEEMQQEAEQKGQLNTALKFSLSPAYSCLTDA
jgi:hypothetical protein